MTDWSRRSMKRKVKFIDWLVTGINEAQSTIHWLIGHGDQWSTKYNSLTDWSRRSMKSKVQYLFTQDVLIRRWNWFCDPTKKKNWCDVAERYSGSWLLRNFLKLSLKMPTIFWEFGCCKIKLCANKPISFFSYKTGPNVNKKMTHQQLK